MQKLFNQEQCMNFSVSRLTNVSFDEGIPGRCQTENEE